MKKIKFMYLIVSVFLILGTFSFPVSSDTIDTIPDTIVYNSADAFTLEHNNGPDWFWQTYSVKTKQYINMEYTSTDGAKNWWVNPNPFTTDPNRVNSGNTLGAITKELMYPENLQNLDSSETHYVVRTFVSSYKATATITHSGEFIGAQAGTRRARIMLNDRQIWPTDGTWCVVAGWGTKFPFPSEGITVEVYPGDRLHFEVANIVEGKDNTYRYNSQVRWIPVVTLSNIQASTNEETFTASEEYSLERQGPVWTYESTHPSFPIATHQKEYEAWGIAGWTFGYADHTRGAVGQDWILPDQFPEWDNDNVFISRVFNCPYDTAYVRIEPSKISGIDYRCDAIVKIMKNDEQIWPKEGTQQMTGASSIWTPAIGITLKAGDKIYFSINKNGTNYNDRVLWDPQVTVFEFTQPEMLGDVEAYIEDNIITAEVSIFNSLAEAQTNIFTPILAMYLNVDSDNRQLLKVKVGETVSLRPYQWNTQTLPLDVSEFEEDVINSSTLKVMLLDSLNNIRPYVVCYRFDVEEILPKEYTFNAAEMFSTEQQGPIWTYESSHPDYPLADKIVTIYESWGPSWAFYYTDATRGAIGRTWIMPDQYPSWDGMNVVISRVFNAPAASNEVIIKPATVQGLHWQCESRIRIMKNDEQLWPQSDWFEVKGTNSYSIPEIRTTVKKGDKIYFSINKHTTNYNDRIEWIPEIVMTY